MEETESAVAVDHRAVQSDAAQRMTVALIDDDAKKKAKLPPLVLCGGFCGYRQIIGVVLAFVLGITFATIEFRAEYPKANDSEPSALSERKLPSIIT